MGKKTTHNTSSSRHGHSSAHAKKPKPSTVNEAAEKAAEQRKAHQAAKGTTDAGLSFAGPSSPAQPSGGSTPPRSPPTPPASSMSSAHEMPIPGLFQHSAGSQEAPATSAPSPSSAIPTAPTPLHGLPQGPPSTPTVSNNDPPRRAAVHLTGINVSFPKVNTGTWTTPTAPKPAPIDMPATIGDDATEPPPTKRRADTSIAPRTTSVAANGVGPADNMPTTTAQKPVTTASGAYPGLNRGMSGPTNASNAASTSQNKRIAPFETTVAQAPSGPFWATDTGNVWVTGSFGGQRAPSTAIPPPVSTHDQLFQALAGLSRSQPNVWEALVGLYLVESGADPSLVFGNERCTRRMERWHKNFRRMDQREEKPQDPQFHTWTVEQAPPAALEARQFIYGNYMRTRSLEHAIKVWGSQPELDAWVDQVVRRADWTTTMLWNSPDWHVVCDILKMPEGTVRDKKIDAVRKESPRLFEAVLNHPFAGIRKIKLKSGFIVYQHRELGTTKYLEVPEPDTSSPKRLKKMDGSYHGRPTQVHGVPLEERALDSKGNRLPWALEWHPDHPNARGQRRHIEEKGPFGKSNRRKALSRTRTITPAKKENPALEGFEKALKYDLSREAQSQHGAPGSRLQGEGNLAPRHPISTNKKPTQVILFGYSTDSQWAVLDLFERISNGMICEDYARDPPPSLKRYPSTFSSPRRRRELTPAERHLAFKYDGGDHWVKVTFDSAEAADRVIESSPAQVYGHWVYAQHYHGQGPQRDEPIPLRPGEAEARRSWREPHTFGASYTQSANQQQGAGTTLPRSFAPASQADADQPHETSPSSSTTATSATATGTEHPDLRQRQTSQTPQTAQPQKQQMMRHFPDVPKTILRPASEALLPQPTWWERNIQWLAEKNLIPGDIIGNGIPMTEDGKPDLSHASFYWKFFYWIDSILGTDICGLKEDDGPE